MAVDEHGLICGSCGRQTLHRRQQANHVLHALITLFSCGFWGIVWFFDSVKQRPWLCSQCGSPWQNPDLVPAPAVERPPVTPMSPLARKVFWLTLSLPVVWGVCMAAWPSIRPSFETWWAKDEARRQWGCRTFGVSLCPSAPWPADAPATPTPKPTPAASARDEELARVIRSAGQTCGSATRAMLVNKTSQQGEFWSVQCRSGRAFQVQIKPDGDTSVLGCDLYAKVTSLKCFEKF